MRPAARPSIHPPPPICGPGRLSACPPSRPSAFLSFRPLPGPPASWPGHIIPALGYSVGACRIAGAGYSGGSMTDHRRLGTGGHDGLPTLGIWRVSYSIFTRIGNAEKINLQNMVCLPTDNGFHEMLLKQPVHWQCTFIIC
jgi:hypothetical protein